MSLTLVYIGAAAASAPAASLRALAGGAVFVPTDADEALRRLIAAAAEPVPNPVVELDASDQGALDELVVAAGSDEVVVALAGPAGPRLARALRARLSPSSIRTVPDGPVFDDLLLGQELVALRRIVDVLRVECPWDREQTPRDIVSYTIEEAYELADATTRGDAHAEHGELGDLLLQVVILAMMLDERGAGDLGSVAHGILVKLVRRHPHIFADAEAETAAEVKGRWERIKREQEGREGIFHDVPATLPALLLARKLQQRAAAVGFDWPSAAEAFPKIAEEHGELAEVLGVEEPDGEGRTAAASAGRHDARLRHEVGDLLFAVVNVARLAHVDPELALREAARRFERRVLAAAALAAHEDVDWAAVPLPEQEAYYQRAKAGGDVPPEADGPTALTPGRDRS
jgi:MazG family protein